MIIMDFSHVSRPTIFNSWSKYIKTAIPFEQLYKINMLTRMNEIILRHRKESWERIILAVDSKNNWRKNHLSIYKSKRKNVREKDSVDWKRAFAVEEEFLDELRENFLFEILKVEGMEGDDILGIITHHEYVNEEITIIAVDKDFFQLQKLHGVQQFDYRGEPKTCEDPEFHLLQMILIGDQADEIPNVLRTEQDVINKVKTDPFGEKNAEKVINGEHKKYKLEELCETENFKRNQLLIDFSFIPEDLKREVIDQHINYRYRGSYDKIDDYISSLPSGKNYSYMVKNFTVTERPDMSKSFFQRFKERYKIDDQRE